MVVRLALPLSGSVAKSAFKSVLSMAKIARSWTVFPTVKGCFFCIPWGSDFIIFMYKTTDLCHIICHFNNRRNKKCKYIMIKITLKLFVTLSKYLPEDGEELKIPEGNTVGTLLSDLGIPEDLVKLIFVNGKLRNTAYRLEDNDRVGLFPPVGGG